MRYLAYVFFCTVGLVIASTNVFGAGAAEGAEVRAAEVRAEPVPRDLAQRDLAHRGPARVAVQARRGRE